jgi:hypothetical protein
LIKKERKRGREKEGERKRGQDRKRDSVIEKEMGIRR